MEYLDELDDSAIQALTELSGGIDFHLHSMKPTVTLDNTSSSSTCPVRRRRRVQATYLLRLEHPLVTPWDVANVLGLSRVPELETGYGEDGEANFCRLSQSSIDTLDSWTANHYPRKMFIKIRLGIAHKDSLELPILGRDPTLPHHRPSMHYTPLKSRVYPEHEYPVYYFFYGTLASPSRLSRLFGIPSSQLSRLEAASLLDGQIRTWAGRYRALVDSPGVQVEGFVYSVLSVDQEDALRVYEGDSYEVVIARIILKGTEIKGRTFRFSGFEDELLW